MHRTGKNYQLFEASLNFVQVSDCKHPDKIFQISVLLQNLAIFTWKYAIQSVFKRLSC